MATVKLNSILSSIHGRVGNAVFYYRYNKEYIRLYVIGRDPGTESQKAVRHTFADAVKSWQALTEKEKYKFNKRAGKVCRSGYNLYISEYLKERISAGRVNKPVFEPGRTNSSSVQSRVASVSAPFMPLYKENIANTCLRHHSG